MSKFIESDILELKEKYTDSIAKEIVSFLNVNDVLLCVLCKKSGL